jgi:hypothetical protein
VHNPTGPGVEGDQPSYPLCACVAAIDGEDFPSSGVRGERLEDMSNLKAPQDSPCLRVEHGDGGSTGRGPVGCDNHVSRALINGQQIRPAAHGDCPNSAASGNPRHRTCLRGRENRRDRSRAAGKERQERREEDSERQSRHEHHLGNGLRSAYVTAHRLTSIVWRTRGSTKGSRAGRDFQIKTGRGVGRSDPALPSEPW